MVQINIGCQVTVHPEHTYIYLQNIKGTVGDFDKIKFKIHFIVFVELLKNIKVLYPSLPVLQLLCKFASYSSLNYDINIRINRRALRSCVVARLLAERSGFRILSESQYVYLSPPSRLYLRPTQPIQCIFARRV
jgi:hypothetical protein